jgi:hypothetical protein
MPCQECGSEKLEDTKRSRKSMERQHKGQKKKDKRTNNDLQNITQKTKDQATRPYSLGRKQKKCFTLK